MEYSKGYLQKKQKRKKKYQQLFHFFYITKRSIETNFSFVLGRQNVLRVMISPWMDISVFLRKNEEK
jgi:hypothetical protein